MNTLKKELEKIIETKPFKQKRVTQMALRASVIPPEDTNRVVFYLDKETHLALAAKGLEYKMTVDEMLRRACWLLVSTS
ncbi:MAG: hypothetical protein QM763_03150 [Agriterribacter sp.]